MCHAFRTLHDRENTMHLLVQVGIDLYILGVGMDMATANAACGSGLETRDGSQPRGCFAKVAPVPFFGPE